MGFWQFFFGTKKQQVEEFIKKGALILDVRSQREWDNGHIEDAIHIPIDELKDRVDEIQQHNKPIIACCASGVRSAKAAKFLNLHNIKAINGGGWISLKHKL